MKALLFLLPILVPLASRWVGRQEALILRDGIKLTDQQLRDARYAGVKNVEKIRLMVVDEVPMPTHPILVWIGKKVGLIGGGVAGITLGFGIYLKRGEETNRSLWTHEFVHVAQYERLGSIRGFLKPYLRECLDPGYPLGPMEQEAIEKANVTLDPHNQPT